MTDTVAYIRYALRDMYAPNEINSFIRLIMESVCGLPPHLLPLNKDKALTAAERNAVRQAVGRLKHSEPIQYITGHTSFYGLTFKVNPSVLIPRPETEELVELVIREADTPVRILDAGTGSGCIAVALAHHLPKAEVVAADISAEAIRTAEENARLNSGAVAFLVADILATEALDTAIGGMFDVIVSNPPYVRESEKASMEKNVLLYEPAAALFVPDSDPLVFYRAIVRLCGKKLRKHGRLYVEINEKLGKETAALLQEDGFVAELIRDLSGKDRFIKAHK
ncbi:MAG: release factor glutamine methyltransferase [Bacteroidales bacterium]